MSNPPPPPALELQSYLEESLPTTYGERRSQLLLLVRLAETSERFDDMCKIVKALVELDTYGQEYCRQTVRLNSDERNLLSVAYKHVISYLRSTWRALTSEETEGAHAITEYRRQIEEQLENVCREVLYLLEEHLIGDPIPSVNVALWKESQVFYLKLCGDYYRYLAEFKDPASGCHDSAVYFYDQAYKLSREKNEEGIPVLPSTHPIRLGLALNYSVCFYEIIDQKEKAWNLATHAFKSALECLDDLTEEQYHDATLILTLLRDNLTLWSTNKAISDLTQNRGAQNEFDSDSEDHVTNQQYLMGS